MTRFCNRCNLERPARDGTCPCGCPEFRLGRPEQGALFEESEMDRVILTIGGEQFAPAASLLLLRRTPAGLAPIRADRVKVGDLVLFDVLSAGAAERRPIEGVVEAVRPLVPKTGEA